MQFGSYVLAPRSNTFLLIQALTWEVSRSKAGALESKSSILVILMVAVV